MLRNPVSGREGLTAHIFRKRGHHLEHERCWREESAIEREHGHGQIALFCELLIIHCILSESPVPFKSCMRDGRNTVSIHGGSKLLRGQHTHLALHFAHERRVEVRLAAGRQRLRKALRRIEREVPGARVRTDARELRRAGQRHVQDRQTGDAGREPACESVGNHAADVVADEVGRAHVEEVDEAEQVGCHDAFGVAVHGAIGRVDSAQVDCDDVVMDG